MIKLDQDVLDVVPEDQIIVFGEQSEPRRTCLKSYPIIREFDGVLCDFQFPEGGGYFTILPISSMGYNVKKTVTLTIMQGWVEYEITDDWGKYYHIYIRTAESDVIFKSLLAYKNRYGIIAVLK
tara:strand:+ start:3418 stop:3789 length:372 start_codon:yes stop_codon:yes gene_type:complete